MRMATAVYRSGDVEKTTALRNKDQPAAANLEAIPAEHNVVRANGQQGFSTSAH